MILPPNSIFICSALRPLEQLYLLNISLTDKYVVFGLHDRMPVFLALLLGFQHALAMLAGVITPPIILA
jgi:hypothetical protein